MQFLFFLGRGSLDKKGSWLGSMQEMQGEITLREAYCTYCFVVLYSGGTVCMPCRDREELR